MKRLYLDIETTGLSFYNPRNIIIGYGLLFEDGEKEEVKIDCIRHQDEEEELLRNLIEEIRNFNPEELVTYNGTFFDIPYILVRSWMNGVDASVLYSIKHIDVYLIVREDIALPRKSLDYVAWSLGYSTFDYPIKSMRIPQIWLGYSEEQIDEYRDYIINRLKYDVKALQYVYHRLVVNE